MHLASSAQPFRERLRTGCTVELGFQMLQMRQQDAPRLQGISGGDGFDELRDFAPQLADVRRLLERGETDDSLVSVWSGCMAWSSAPMPRFTMGPRAST